MRILLAEGSLIIADRLTSVLSQIPGVEVVKHASRAAGVMASLEDPRMDAAIVDPHLAGTEGIELLRNIKRQRPGLLLIAVSNFSCRAYSRRCLEAGADYFLDKSTDFDRIAKLIGSIQKATAKSLP